MANDSVLVFSEVPDVLAEMIGLGSELRAATGRRLVALAIGPDAKALGRDCLARGVDEALVLEIGDDKAGAAEALAEAFARGGPALWRRHYSGRRHPSRRRGRSPSGAPAARALRLGLHRRGVRSAGRPRDRAAGLRRPLRGAPGAGRPPA